MDIEGQIEPCHKHVMVSHKTPRLLRAGICRRLQHVLQATFPTEQDRRQREAAGVEAGTP